MAERRMISKALITSDEYTDLSFEAQALYVQLTVEADDFGFVNGVKKIMRSIGVNADTLDELEKARFVIRFDSGVFVIRHWFYANFGGDFNKNDRTISTRFFDELTRLTVDVNAAYVLLDSAGTPLELQRNPDGVPSIVKSSPVQSRVLEYIRRAVEKSIKESSGSSSSSSSSSQEQGDNDNDKDMHGAAAAADPPDKVREALEKTGWATNATWQMVQRFRVYNRMDDQMLLYALDQTLCAEYPERYLKTVLEDYRANGFHTIADVIQREQQRDKPIGG